MQETKCLGVVESPFICVGAHHRDTLSCPYQPVPASQSHCLDDASSFSDQGRFCAVVSDHLQTSACTHRQFPSPIEISHRHFRGKISSPHALQLHRVFRFPQNSHSMSLHRPLPHRHRRTQVSLILQRARQTNTPSLSKFRQPLLHPLLRQLQARTHTHTRACARAYTHESMNVYVRAQRLVGVVFISLSLSSLSHLYFGISREQRIRARILSMLRSERLLAGFSSTRILHCNDVSLTYALVYLFLRVSYVNLHVHSLILSHSHTHTNREKICVTITKKKNKHTSSPVCPSLLHTIPPAHTLRPVDSHTLLPTRIHPFTSTPHQSTIHTYIHTQKRAQHKTVSPTPPSPILSLS